MADPIDRRLARAEGHLRAVRTMVSDGRPCDEVLQQVLAVQAAIARAAEALVEREAEVCLRVLAEDAPEDARDQLRRLHTAFRRLASMPRSRPSRERELEDDDGEDGD